MRFTLRWDAGATAEIELHEPSEGGTYGLRYNSPYRSTLRSPMEALRVGPETLDRTRRRLQEFSDSLQLAAARGSGGDGQDGLDSTDALRRIGLDLYELVLPQYVRSDLREPIFIEFAVDENLLALPWELMHDGVDFVGKKHAIGRFINLTTRPEHEPAVRPRGVGSELGDLKVLIVGVPRPTPTDGIQFDELTAVEPETNAIIETLVDLGIEPTVLLKEDATYDAVRAELRKEYHIIHFSGHAAFNEDAPNRSALMLHDDKLATGAIMMSFSRHPAILCFINGCETTRTAADDGAEQSWENRYNNYGLARSFLETGSYLLGSRWRLDDDSARIFATTFYSELLGEGAPVGKAIVTARIATAEQSSGANWAWASYVYYGDPRITIRREQDAAVAQPPPQAPAAESAEQNRQLRDLAQRYEDKRRELEPGWARTVEMTHVVDEATAIAEELDVTSFAEELWGESEGGRVVALGLLQANPSPQYFDLMLDSVMESESTFEQYLALQVLRRAASQLDREQAVRLRSAIEELSEREDFFGTDRYSLANQIAMQLASEEPPVMA